MTLRQRITLWIAATALLAATGFSVFLYLELVEEPFELIDTELHQLGHDLVARGTAATPPWQLDTTTLPYPAEQYWIEVYDDTGRRWYRSGLAELFSLDRRPKAAYLEERIIPREVARLGQDSHDEVTFRVVRLQITLDDNTYTAWLAKPVEALEEELLEVLREVGAGLVSCTLVIVVVSWWLAGRVLQPVAAMTRLARTIDSGNLESRLPEDDGRDELSELARMLNEMLDRLHHSFERQKEFLANGAHELKRPLARLSLRLERLRERIDLTEEAQQEVAALALQVRQMSRLVQKLLDLSRLEMRPEMHTEEIDLAALVTALAAEYRELAHASAMDLEVTTSGDCRIRGDGDMLRRLAANLLDNALRYNVPGGNVKVGCQGGGDAVMLTVGNTGPGVPVEETERVFDQFHRVEKSRSTATGGTGLGLTIARRIVELHGGTIRLDSEPDRWTEVTVVLEKDGP